MRKNDIVKIKDGPWKDYFGKIKNNKNSPIVGIIGTLSHGANTRVKRSEIEVIKFPKGTSNKQKEEYVKVCLKVNPPPEKPMTAVGVLNVLFKENYSGILQELIPDGVKILSKISSLNNTKLGNLYNQPIILGVEHNVSSEDEI